MEGVWPPQFQLLDPPVYLAGFLTPLTSNPITPRYRACR